MFSARCLSRNAQLIPKKACLGKATCTLNPKPSALTHCLPFLTFRCSKFSSFNQPMEDAANENWNIFAPIAKLESLDEIDQV
jgi:hypothetical protein